MEGRRTEITECEYTEDLSGSIEVHIGLQKHLTKEERDLVEEATGQFFDQIKMLIKNGNCDTP